MFKNVRIQTKMLLSYAVPALIYLGFSGLFYSTVTQVVDAFKEVDRTQKVVIQANTIALGAQGIVRSFRGYMINKNQEFLREYQANLKLSRKADESIRELIIRNDQKDRMNKLIQLIDEYDEQSKNMIRLVNEGKQDQALILFNSGVGTRFVNDFDRINRDFETTEQKMLEEKTKKAKDSLQFLLSILILGSLLLLGLSVTIALFISSGISNAINQAVTAIASSSVQIAATVTQQERTSAQQASSVHQTTTTMDELGASSRHAAERAESSAENARQLLKLAESSAVGAHQVLSLAGEGSESVGQTLEGISILKEKVAEISEQIMRLSQQTNQIGIITSLVTDLANQTNMLALNAAVEAVRAGEHGKGFGVVASEIRKLADQSKKSAEKINNLINEIQSSINLTVMVTNEGQKKAEEGIKISQGTAEAFSSLSQAINEIILNNQQNSLAAINQVVESCQQISLTSKQQAIAIQQVVEAMTAINQGASETASGISQTKIGTQKLNEAALALKAIV